MICTLIIESWPLAGYIFLPYENPRSLWLVVPCRYLQKKMPGDKAGGAGNQGWLSLVWWVGDEGGREGEGRNKK